MRNFGSFFAAISMLSAVFISTGASADDGSWYARLNTGFTSLSDSDLSLSGQAASGAEFDGGTLFGGAVGKQFGPIRVEGEIAYRSNDISSHSLAGYRQGDDAGDFASLGFGLNVLYETNLFGSKKAVTYFGGGLVYLEEIDVDLFSPTNDEVSFSDNDFGIQLIAGARYEVAKTWNLFAELRYFDAGTVTLSSETNSGLTIEADYASTAVVFGVGYRF